MAVAVVLLVGSNQLGRSRAIPFPVPAVYTPSPTQHPSSVWVVQETALRTLYSNGLTVQREYEVSGMPRSYHSYHRATLHRSNQAAEKPVGIVFHTTESEILPLEEAHNKGLLRSREDLLHHVQNGRCYNFVIDRFGQVSRIVPEAQTALHAGHSVWASEDTVWIDLNESFLGIAFEAESARQYVPSAAQLQSGRLLTEMLRAKYSIPGANCVTHAQVSVNPDNMRAGYHTDWGGAFPFSAMGLSEGYASAVASVAVFGFGHDGVFLQSIGNQPWPGLTLADREIAWRSAQQGLTANEFREQLQQQYKTLRRQRHG